MNQRYLLLSLLLGLSFCVCGQSDPGCLFDQLLEPAAFERQTSLVASTAQQRTEIHVRTVIHILYATPEGNVSDSLISEVMDQINHLIHAQDIDTSLIHPEHRHLVTNAQINFCLAQTDPAGNPTNGITRKAAALDYFPGPAFTDSTSTEVVKTDSLGGITPWDTERYLNIWIAPMVSADNTSNYGIPKVEFMPGGPILAFSDLIPGVVMDIDAILNQPNNGANIIVHEIGHALGLLHPWGFPGTCEFDDLIDDTPTCQFPGGNCLDDANSCIEPTDDRVDNSANFMGYSCMQMLTPGQVQAIRSNLLDLNPELLLTNYFCNLVTSTTPPVGTAIECALFPNPNHGTFQLNYQQPQLSDVTIHLYDAVGRLLQTDHFSNTRTINKAYQVSADKSGIYFMTIYAGDQITVKKIMVGY